MRISPIISRGAVVHTANMAGNWLAEKCRNNRVKPAIYIPAVTPTTNKCAATFQPHTF